jgi:O-antigen ligase
MPPQFAALLCIAFISYLFWQDLTKSKGLSVALWIPLIWMFFAGSRYLSLWLNLSPPFASTADYLEGSPLDRNVFLLLMAAGIAVLHHRRLRWGELISENRWIWLYFAWGATSVLWSDYPFVSFKRLTKALGNGIMALIVLTEKDRYGAVGTLLRRLAFVLVPLSILFIKYYPDLGRAYHPWTFQPMFTGVALQKNGLGQICLVSGIYFCWVLFQRQGWRQKPPLYITVLFLCMIIWLLSMANSATSLTCLILVVGLVGASRLPPLRREPRKLLALGIVVTCVLGFVESVFGLSSTLVALLGRDMTLTTRVPIWQDLLQMSSSPLFGAGYESFWLDDRLQGFWEEHGGIRQAHNGYLEVYLNVGLVGLGVLLAGVLSGLVKVHQSLKAGDKAAVLRLCLMVPVVIYNWTEATFVGVSNMWLLFLLGTVDVCAAPSAAAKTRQQAQSSALAGDSHPRRNVVQQAEVVPGPSRRPARSSMLNRSRPGIDNNNVGRTKPHEEVLAERVPD